MRNIKNSWKKFILKQQKLEYFQRINLALKQLKNEDEIICPAKNEIYRAFALTPLEKVKVVIIGQDPYHGENQANGLAFSVNKGQKIPPSLRNIYREISQNYPDFVIPDHGDLSAWAEQGVLLLNSSLTVSQHKAGSHSKIGWHKFCENCIYHLNDHDPIVFMLWGNFAKTFAQFINHKKHLVLTSPHPSPLSAHHGFFGNNHFKTANKWLIDNNKEPINWQI